MIEYRDGVGSKNLAAVPFFKFKFLDDMSPFYGATDTPVLDLLLAFIDKYDVPTNQ